MIIDPIPEPETGAVIDYTGHVWVKDPTHGWMCIHDEGDETEEFYWDWHDIVQDAEGKLQIL